MTAGSEYFDRGAASYLERSSRGLWKWVREAESRSVLRSLDLSPGLTVLDIGCGPGYYGLAIAGTYRCNVLGVDRSEAMLAEYTKNGLAGLRAEFPALPAELGKFDRVLCAGVMEFVLDAGLEECYRACRRHMHARSRLVVLAPDKNLRGRIYKNTHERQSCPTRLASAPEHERAAASAGLRKVAEARVLLGRVHCFIPAEHEA